MQSKCDYVLTASSVLQLVLVVFSVLLISKAIATVGSDRRIPEAQSPEYSKERASEEVR